MQNASVQHASARRAFGEGWALARPFWRAAGERRAWLLLAAVVALTLGTVWINVRFSVWNNRFYDTLQNHDLPGFWHQLGVFCMLAAVFIVVAVYRQYLQQLLFMQWRTWLTTDGEKEVVLDSEPESMFWPRIDDMVLGWFVPEHLL
ncbi:MAG: SbmA/BacA-like family transporter [Caldimonas sp.]